MTDKLKKRVDHFMKRMSNSVSKILQIFSNEYVRYAAAKP